MNNGLGRPLSIHRGKFSAGGSAWYIGGVLVVAGLVGIVQGLLGKGLEHSGIGLVGLVIGLVVLLLPLARWKQTLEIFENGFVWKRLFGTTTVTRDQIVAAKYKQFNEKLNTVLEFSIELNGGKLLVVVGIDQAEQAANLLAASSAGPSSASDGGSGWTPPSAPATGPAGTGWTPPGGAK
jgi:hypothetical protein